MIFGMDICLKTKSSLCGAYNNTLKDFTCFQGSVLLPARQDFLLKKTHPVQCLDQMLKIQT